MIFLPIEKNMRRRRKRKRQKGGIIQPSSIIPFLESSTMMPGTYLKMWERKKKKKKEKKQKTERKRIIIRKILWSETHK